MYIHIPTKQKCQPYGKTGNAIRLEDGSILFKYDVCKEIVKISDLATEQKLELL